MEFCSVVPALPLDGFVFHPLRALAFAFVKMLEAEGGLEWHDLVGLQFNPAAQKYPLWGQRPTTVEPWAVCTDIFLIWTLR